MTPDDPDDPRGLIREAYAMDGIGLPECRTIFLDWALGLPEDVPVSEAAARLLKGRPPDHPISEVLREVQAAPPPRTRRGGWKARHRE